MNTSGFFSINLQDLTQASANAVVIAVVAALYGTTTTTGFDVFSTDWVMIGKLVVNSAFIAFVASIATALITSKEGRVLGGPRVK